MDNPSIYIAHRMHNRIRLKLSHPIRNVDRVKKDIENKQGIVSFEYSEITRSILIHFESLKIDMVEIIVRVSIEYSKEYNLSSIKVLNKNNCNSMPKGAYYSVGVILASYILKSVSPRKGVHTILNWLSVGSTASAIVEHALMEIKNKGSFDPEVVSVMYLFDSVRKGNYLGAAFITWITTFGRHLVNRSYGGIVLNIKEFEESRTKEKYYNVEFEEYRNIENKIDLVKEFASECIQCENNNLCKNNVMVNKTIMKNFSKDISCNRGQAINRFLLS
ncbi:hypothetical protein [Clostridium sp. CTA-1]